VSQKKLDPFSFKHNFCKYCLILIILSLKQTEIICPRTCNWIEFATSPTVCCCPTLKKCNHNNTSSQKLLNKSVTHVVISLLLQSTKFWWYLLLYSMSTYLVLIVPVNLVCIKFLIWHLATKIRFWSKTCVVQKVAAPKTNEKVSWKRLEQKWTVMQRHVCQRQIHSVVNWNGSSSMSGEVLNSRFLTSGEEDIERVSVLKEDTSSTACELTVLILSISVTLTVASLL